MNKASIYPSIANVGLVITTYERAMYFQQCVNSLLGLKHLPLYIVVVDDNSTHDLPSIEMNVDMLRIAMPETRVDFVHKKVRVGVKENLLTGINMAFVAGMDYVINLDGDAIVKPNFIKTLLSLHRRHNDSIVSGFNCDNPQNPVIGSGKGYVRRKHCNGINMMFNESQFEKIVRPSLLKRVGNWDFDCTHSKSFVISCPSVVEHIGRESSMGHIGGDFSCDFNVN